MSLRILNIDQIAQQESINSFQKFALGLLRIHGFLTINPPDLDRLTSILLEQPLNIDGGVSERKRNSVQIVGLEFNQSQADGRV